MTLLCLGATVVGVALLIALIVMQGVRASNDPLLVLAMKIVEEGVARLTSRKGGRSVQALASSFDFTFARNEGGR